MSRPACAAALGAMLWSVMPGNVFTSRTQGRRSASSRTSTLTNPYVANALAAATAVSLNPLTSIGARPVWKRYWITVLAYFDP